MQRCLFQATREAETRFRLFLARALERSVGGGSRASRKVRAGRRLPM